ncbi:STAS domain-containing protein [Streptomyces purpureus]|uniref:STAS domain-containing protein n=1 Tax=Streptomyces purpureus TaxID=1951 RepID=UPI00035EB618|nr:STAS domain-containing protein [Streptomyces purpureus]
MEATQPIVLQLSGRITRADVPALCAELAARLSGADPTEVVCEVGALTHADLAAVDALARLRLTAHRLGHTLRLRGADGRLRLLLGLVGLEELLLQDPP